MPTLREIMGQGRPTLPQGFMDMAKQRSKALQGALANRPPAKKIPLGPQGQENWQGIPWGYKSEGGMDPGFIRQPTPRTFTDPLTGKVTTFPTGPESDPGILRPPQNNRPIPPQLQQLQQSILQRLMPQLQQRQQQQPQVGDQRSLDPLIRRIIEQIKMRNMSGNLGGGV